MLLRLCHYLQAPPEHFMQVSGYPSPLHTTNLSRPPLVSIRAFDGRCTACWRQHSGRCCTHDARHHASSTASRLGTMRARPSPWAIRAGSLPSSTRQPPHRDLQNVCPSPSAIHQPAGSGGRTYVNLHERQPLGELPLVHQEVVLDLLHPHAMPPPSARPTLPSRHDGAAAAHSPRTAPR